MKTLFEISKKGTSTGYLPKLDIQKKEDIENIIPKKLIRDSNDLPELNEVDIVRHYTKLSKRNFGVDLGFYPLGSCTMKYNPKINEDLSRLNGFADSHRR